MSNVLSVATGKRYFHLIAQMIRAFGMNPKVGSSSPSQVETSQKLWHLHKNISSCVGNECCNPRTVNISNVNFTSNISILPEPVFNNMGQQMFGPDKLKRLEHLAWLQRLGVENIFCLKSFDTFTRTSVRVSQMNAAARAQLIFQMLTLLRRYLYCQSQFSKTWDSRCLALIAEMVWAFGMNPKVGGSSPSQVENIFYLKIFDIFTRTSVRMSAMNAVARAQQTFQILALLQIYIFIHLRISSKYMFYIAVTAKLA